MSNTYEEIMMLQSVGSFIRGFFFVMLITIAFSFTISIMYSFSMYTVSRRRGIDKAWLAWVPVGNYWNIGSISDQYRYVCRGKVTNRRKILAALAIALGALGIIMVYIYIDTFAGILENAALRMGDPEEAFLVSLGMKILLISAITLAVMAVDIVLMVFFYISLHDFYASTRPDRKVLYLVLSILIPVTMPFFVFSCRYADAGMPPRRTPVVPQPSALPQYPPRGPEF